MIRIYSQHQQGQNWLNRFHDIPVLFACALGYTETAAVPNISTAGATPEARRSPMQSACIEGLTNRQFIPYPR